MLLTVNEVSKSYKVMDKHYPILRDINVQVEQGQFVSILGRSGSGKTTLLNILAGIDQPDTGHVMVEDIDLYSMSEKQRTDFRRKNIGFIFQSFNLIPVLNVTENIVFPQKEKGNRRGLELIEMLGIEQQKDFYPNQLSGGQQQRVAIARALINNPKIILADEPTGNLDAESEKIVMKTLLELKSEGSTIIMITHNEEIAKQTDYVVRLENGVLRSWR